MSVCKHTGWTKIWNNGQTEIEVSDRPSRLLEELDDDAKPVGFIALLGNQMKSLVLADLCPRLKSSGRARQNGEIHLSVSNIRPKTPVIIGDGDILDHSRLPTSHRSYQCHESVNRVVLLNQHLERASDLVDEAYQRLLFPFADVIVLFVADIGGIHSAIRRILQWVSSNHPIPNPSTLLLVTPRGQKNAMKVAIDNLKVSAHSLLEHFNRVEIITLSRSRNTMWQKRQIKRLYQRISSMICAAQEVRRSAGSLFAARHTAAFLHIAAENMGESSHLPMDFIKASRKSNPVAPDLPFHLLNWFKQYDNVDALKRIAIPVAASSFILDQYPPGMHHFPFRAAFRSMYKALCSRVAEGVEAYRGTQGLAAAPVNLVQLLEDQGVELLQDCQAAKDLHIRQLTHAYGCLLPLICEDTCFFCIRRKPQYRLPCRHWMCQTCVRTFGRLDPSNRWLYYIDSCILCDTSTDGMSICVKPPTATARVLSIDGGGIRGCVPLEFLRALQQAVNLPFPVHRNFDVIFGTSSRAMIACALCINGWSLDQCIQYFEASSQRAFEKRFQTFESLFGHVPVIVPAFQFLISLLVDSKYSAQELELIQQAAYGIEQSIVESKEAREAGAHLGITLTSTDSTNTYIVTNYNGVGDRDGGGDGLRCCTAAPYYFTPHNIHRVGTFQDGGLTFNNPALIAIRETAAIFPQAPRPSIVLSLGTGFTTPGVFHDTKQTEWHQLWTDSFPSRLFRAFWKHGDSNVAWKHLLTQQTVHENKKYFRFDIQFKSAPPALDDTAGMPAVARMAREAAMQYSAIETLARNIRAELFIFELSCRPRYLRNGVYLCSGNLYCRLQANSTENGAFMEQLTRSSAFFQWQAQRLSASFDHISSSRGIFCQEVSFRVKGRHEEFRITLHEGPSLACDISGSPFTIERLIQQQGLDVSFGRDDHQKSLDS